jgi:hypothetical protein
MKGPPITRKIKRLFLPAKGKQPHKLYPKQYFWQCWFDEPHSNGIRLVAKCEGISKKAAAQQLNEWGLKHFMGLKWKEELDAMNSPEGQTKQAKDTRFILELRRICRENGWDVNQILK